MMSLNDRLIVPETSFSRACHQLEDLTKSRRNAEVEAENFLDHQVNYAPLRSQRRPMGKN
ncbi:hypothetical protein [Planktothricoides raciborskii]|uniref:Uncharacterized protein n=1 Tax=Planktothricoides raciborskii GIHE-MW2 TaxID=2792601 RepID=A0AAU8JBM7_9CYAN